MNDLTNENQLNSALTPNEQKINFVQESGFNYKKINQKNLSIEEVDYVWDGFELGTVGCLFSQSGVGKTQFILEASFAIATAGISKSTDLLKINSCKRGKVFYFNNEDSSTNLGNRYVRINQEIKDRLYKNFNKEVIDEYKESIDNNLEIFSVLERTDLLQEQNINSFIKTFNLYQNVRLIIFDTVNKFHSGDENSSSDMTRLMNNIGVISRNTGASVMILHHITKESIKNNYADKQHASRGSTVLVDNSRYCASLKWEEKSNNVIFSTSKQSNEPTVAQILKRTDYGVLIKDFESNLKDFQEDFES
jgi:RecA-family ATPase